MITIAALAPDRSRQRILILVTLDATTEVATSRAGNQQMGEFFHHAWHGSQAVTLAGADPLQSQQALQVSFILEKESLVHGWLPPQTAVLLTRGTSRDTTLGEWADKPPEKARPFPGEPPYRDSKNKFGIAELQADRRGTWESQR